MLVRIVAFEAWNITRYVFVTNKRREIAGASELITYLDRRWVHDSLRDTFPGFHEDWRIESQPVELMTAGAGAVKLLMRDADSVRALVASVTLKALRDAPGLDVYGVVGELFEWGSRSHVADALRETVGRLEEARGSRPGPDVRALRLPIADECATTGLPASYDVEQPGGGTEPRSAESLAKWRAYARQDEGDGLDKLAELAGTTPRQLGRVVEYLQGQAEWVAVIYIDGNGLGGLFERFDALVERDTARCYVDTLREFVHGLDQCARDALTEAVGHLRGTQHGTVDGAQPAVLPLILGGDDVILLCDGRIALDLAVKHLRAFERLTGSTPSVAEPLRRRGGGHHADASSRPVDHGTVQEPSHLSASAGVAVVKSHHPFDSAARLAYELLTREAKRVKTEVDGACSAMAFHVLYDSNDARLDRLRTGSPGAAQRPTHHLSAQPYVVSEIEDRAGWMRGRRWDDLLARMNAISARDDDGERRLPASQLHKLRQALFIGPDVADARLANLQARYRSRGLEFLCGDVNSLFWSEPGPTPRRVTGLLDALDAASITEDSR